MKRLMPLICSLVLALWCIAASGLAQGAEGQVEAPGEGPASASGITMV